MAHSHCTEPETERVLGPGMMGLYIMPLTIHTKQGQGPGPGTNGLLSNFPGPGLVQCEWAIKAIQYEVSSPHSEIKVTTYLSQHDVASHKRPSKKNPSFPEPEFKIIGIFSSSYPWPAILQCMIVKIVFIVCNKLQSRFIWYLFWMYGTTWVYST